MAFAGSVKGDSGFYRVFAAISTDRNTDNKFNRPNPATDYLSIYYKKVDRLNDLDKVV
jgi:hypothetical protein